jgi:hypothetical protein
MIKLVARPTTTNYDLVNQWLMAMSRFSSY